MGLLSREEYHDYCKRFDIAWKYLSSCSYEVNSVVEKICELRGYSLEGSMPETLKNIGFLYLDKEVFDEQKLKLVDAKGDLGLYSSEGKFLLTTRFIFPVKDMLGNIIALIGWFPDEKKYITTPSRLFSKQGIFFGMEQLSETGIGKKYFLVEGIFDCISIRSLGFNCVALMGISANNNSKVLYTLFSRLVAIPDNDKQGRKVIENDLWGIPTNASYLRWKNNVKDIDDMIKFYDMSNTLSDALKEKDRVLVID